jgi:hypothetical protein
MLARPRATVWLIVQPKFLPPSLKNEALFLQEMIDEADRDGDGEVSLEEFERIMRVNFISAKESPACPFQLSDST